MVERKAIEKRTREIRTFDSKIAMLNWINRRNEKLKEKEIWMEYNER